MCVPPAAVHVELEAPAAGDVYDFRAYAHVAWWTHHCHANNKIAGRIMPILSKRDACLDPGSGPKIPAIWHGAGAFHGGFIPET